MDIKAPTFPESISEGTVAQWHKAVGEFARRDDLLADIETDKVVIEVVAPSDGSLTEILKQEGDEVLSEEVIAHFEAGEAAAPPVAAPVADADEEAGGASPAARKLAAESGVDIGTVEGSGRDGSGD